MCVGFILVIILSKQELITSKDSISQPCLSEAKVAEQPLLLLSSVPEGSWLGFGVVMEGQLPPKQHLWGAQNW